jgi:hypothetical protein
LWQGRRTLQSYREGVANEKGESDLIVRQGGSPPACLTVGSLSPRRRSRRFYCRNQEPLWQMAWRRNRRFHNCFDMLLNGPRYCGSSPYGPPRLSRSVASGFLSQTGDRITASTGSRYDLDLRPAYEDSKSRNHQSYKRLRHTKVNYIAHYRSRPCKNLHSVVSTPNAHAGMALWIVS